MKKEKYLEKIKDLFNQSPVVSANSIGRIIKNKEYTKQIIHNLIIKKKIKKLAKGQYTSHDEIELAVFCFKPSYLGLQNALSFHNLWEQETIPIIITSRKVRQGIRKILGINVLIKRITKEYLFGFEYDEYQFYLPHSDIEKTFIDMLYFKEKINNEVKQELLKRLNKKRLNIYLKKYPKRFRKQAMNILNKKSF